MDIQANDRSVFVVHGRNLQLRDSMFDFLRSIDLSPMEWTKAVELTGEGSPYTGQVLDVAFAHAAAIVVLITPDEVAYLDRRYGLGDDDPDTKPGPQARPNVLFEAGMAMGRDAKRTVLVEVGKTRQFSDIAGRHVIRLSNEVGTRQSLAHRLGTAGCAVNISGTDWHRVGDFTAPPPPGSGLPVARRIPNSTESRPPIDFDLRLTDRGGSRLSKLQIINRGTETAYDVDLQIPEGCALSRHSDEVIKKIPSNKSVTINVFNNNGVMSGPPTEDSFDILITAKAESGDLFRQEVFLDVNGS